MTDEQMAELKVFIAQEVEAAVARAIEAAKADRVRRAEPTAKDKQALKEMLEKALREHQSREWQVLPMGESVMLPENPIGYWQYTGCHSVVLPKCDVPVVVTG